MEIFIFFYNFSDFPFWINFNLTSTEFDLLKVSSASSIVWSIGWLMVSGSKRVDPPRILQYLKSRKLKKKSKFRSKIKNLDKNQKFGQTSKIDIKIVNVGGKYKIFTKIQN